jgi:hypothetical protein
VAIRREDYILRLIEELQLMIAQAVAERNEGKLGQALLSAVAAQEKLFARPTADFAARGIDEQLRLLTVDESPATARAKCLAYAALLEESGRIYAAKNRADLAASANQLALFVTLTVAAGDRPRRGELQPQIDALLARLRPGPLYPPVQEMLDRLA